MSSISWMQREPATGRYVQVVIVTRQDESSTVRLYIDGRHQGTFTSMDEARAGARLALA